MTLQWLRKILAFFFRFALESKNQEKKDQRMYISTVKSSCGGSTHPHSISKQTKFSRKMETFNSRKTLYSEPAHLQALLVFNTENRARPRGICKWTSSNYFYQYLLMFFVFLFNKQKRVIQCFCITLIWTTSDQKLWAASPAKGASGCSDV